MYKLLPLLLLILSTSCTRYQGTDLQILKDLKQPYTISKEIPHFPNAHAVYDRKTKMIHFKEGEISGYTILHELLHTVGPVLDPRLDEIVTIKAAFKVASKTGIALGVGRYQESALITKNLAIYGLKPRILTENEKKIVDKEVKNRVQLLEKRLEDSGYKFKKIDWIRTALLLL